MWATEEKFKTLAPYHDGTLMTTITQSWQLNDDIYVIGNAKIHIEQLIVVHAFFRLIVERLTVMLLTMGKAGRSPVWYCMRSLELIHIILVNW